MDKEQLEAARVDGARQLGAFCAITCCRICARCCSVVVVLGMIGNLQHFDTIYALTGGGPVRATTVLSVEVYRRAFEQWDIGSPRPSACSGSATILPPAYFYLRQLLTGA